jgi:hypothetical protein
MAKTAVAVAPKARANAHPPVLEAPRTLSKEPIYNLHTTVRNQFSDVYLIDEKGNRVATIANKDKKKLTKVGATNLAFLCGLIVGALGGRGDAPGGASIWVARNSKKMDHLFKYTLIAEAESRGGTYEAPIPVWLGAVQGKAALLEASIAKHPVPKRVRETTAGSEEEDVDVWL